MFAIIGVCRNAAVRLVIPSVAKRSRGTAESATIGPRSSASTTRAMASSSARAASRSPIPHGIRRSRPDDSVPAPTLFKDRRRRYNWAEIQSYYQAGHTYRQCQRVFGFCAAAWEKARRRGEIKPRTYGKPLEQILISRGGSRRNVKLRLLRSGVFENRCCDLRPYRMAGNLVGDAPRPHKRR